MIAGWSPNPEIVERLRLEQAARAAALLAKATAVSLTKSVKRPPRADLIYSPNFRPPKTPRFEVK